MTEIVVGSNWDEAQPGSLVGTLVLRSVSAPENSEALEARKRQLEERLRESYSAREEILAQPVMQAYSEYYKAFRKKYHVLFQLESVALKRKQIPRVNPLVEAMFVAELENMLLTAGHDLGRVEGPLTVDIASGEESYTLMNGRQQAAQAGDMLMRDEKAVISSVIYGPDSRTRIGQATRNLLFVVYAPPGIGEDRLRRHLADIEQNLRLLDPNLDAAPIEIVAAS